ncbi:hypothetical protein DBR42_00935 [Pelomonas sp. HMWF004]|nr:hypothetical protein DBR42_00935 [Pelomonas sp. HMWF004]
MFKTVSMAYYSQGTKAANAFINPDAVAYFMPSDDDQMGASIVTPIGVGREGRHETVPVNHTPAELCELLGVKFIQLKTWDAQTNSRANGKTVYVAKALVSLVRKKPNFDELRFVDGSTLTVEDAALLLDGGHYVI